MSGGVFVKAIARLSSTGEDLAAEVFGATWGGLTEGFCAVGCLLVKLLLEFVLPESL